MTTVIPFPTGQNVIVLPFLNNVRNNCAYICDSSGKYIFVIEPPTYDDDDLDPPHVVLGKLKRSCFVKNKGRLRPISEEDRQWLSINLPFKYIIPGCDYGSLFFKDVSLFLQRYTCSGTNTNIEELYRMYLSRILPGIYHFTFAKFKSFLPSNFQYAFTDKVTTTEELRFDTTENFDSDSEELAVDSIESKYDVHTQLDFDVTNKPHDETKSDIPATLIIHTFPLQIDGIKVEGHDITINNDIYGKYIVKMTSNDIVICGQLDAPYIKDEVESGFKKEEFMLKFKPATGVVLKEYDDIAFSPLAYQELLNKF